MSDTAQGYLVFDTAAGFCGIAWNDAGITRFQLPTQSAAAAERQVLRRAPQAKRAAPPPEVAEAVDAARRYFSGERMEFKRFKLDLEGQDDLFRQVYDALREVAWGETTTYGALAKAVGGGPELARDVGQAMAKNPVPLIIPCHRVLAAGGKPGGFSAPGGTEAKLRMLALEGVRVGPPPAAQQAFEF